MVIQDPSLQEREPRNATQEKPDKLESRSDAVFAFGLCHIAAPCLIFLVSFVRPVIGWPLAAGLALLLYKLIAADKWTVLPRVMLPAATLSLAVVLLVGIPTGHSCLDWIKHWALINEIANRSWPVSLVLHGEKTYLRYYLASYLFPALAHKAMPFMPVVVAATAWFYAGYFLVFWSIGALLQRRSAWTATLGMVLAAMLSGGDALIRQLVGVMTQNPLHGWLGYHYHSWPELWGWPLQFDSGIANLAWVPHQSIPVFLVTAMFLFDRSKLSLARAIVAFGLLALWSPYGMIGLLSLLALRCRQERRKLATGYATGAIVLGVTFALLVASYLSTDLPKSGINLNLKSTTLAEVGFIGVFLIVGLCAFLLILQRRAFSDSFCFVALATLVVIPFLHGDTVDFVARSSMGPLFVLALCSAETLLDFKLIRQRVVTAALALAICVPASLSEIVYHVEKGSVYHTAEGSKLPEANIYGRFSTGYTLTANGFFDTCGWEFERQYFSFVDPRVLSPR
jgi:hypothetical protein